MSLPLCTKYSTLIPIFITTIQECSLKREETDGHTNNMPKRADALIY